MGGSKLQFGSDDAVTFGRLTHTEDKIKTQKGIVEVLIRVGAYKKGMDLELDSAIAKKERAREFLTQGNLEKYSFDEIVANLRKVLI